MTGSLLLLAALLGLRHALEPDHLAAVAAMAARGDGGRGAARIAGAWALGHGAVLLAFGGAMCAFSAVLPEPAQRGLHALVGVVLVALGLDALRRLRAPSTNAAAAATVPAPRTAARALAVGAVHGLEGSAAVVLAALPLARSRLVAVAWLAVFAAGTLASMVTASLLFAPLVAWRARAADRLLPFACGFACVFVGCWMAARALGA